MSESENSKENHSNRNGWIVCISCVVINYIRISIVYSFGVFIAEFKKIYGSKMAELDWIPVVVIALSDGLAPIPTLIIRKVGTKGYMICSLVGTLLLTAGCFTSSLVDQVSWLFLTFSLSFGVGCCLIFLSSTLILIEFFPPNHRYHVLATSAYEVSYPIAIMSSSPLYAWIIKLTSWRIAFAVAGVKIFILGGICSFLFLLKIPLHGESTEKITYDIEKKSQICDRADEKTSSVRPHGQTKTSSKWSDICRTPERILWLIGTIMIFSSQLVPVINLPHYMEDKGYDKLDASLSLVLLSVFEIITCLVMIQIGHKFKENLIYVNIFSCLAISVMFFAWPSIDPSFVNIMIMSSVFGIIGMLSFVYFYATTLEVMDMPSDLGWTISCFFAGIGTMISPILSGALFDISGSYDIVFYAIAAVCLANGLVFVGIPLSKKFRKRKTDYENMT